MQKAILGLFVPAIVFEAALGCSIMLLSQPEYLSRREKMRLYQPTKVKICRLLHFRLATSFLPILMGLIELIVLDRTAPNSWLMLMHLLNVSVVCCLILVFEIFFRNITESYSFWDPAILEEKAELEKICAEKIYEYDIIDDPPW